MQHLFWERKRLFVFRTENMFQTLRESSRPCDLATQVLRHLGWDKQSVNCSLFVEGCTIYPMPRTQLTSICEGQPPKIRPFPIKTRGPIWVLGVYISMRFPFDHVTTRSIILDRAKVWGSWCGLAKGWGFGRRLSLLHLTILTPW